MAFKIETKEIKKSRSKYPFSKLKVGQSFLVEGVKQSTLSNSCAYHGVKLNMVFKTRSEGDKVRIYRVK